MEPSPVTKADFTTLLNSYINKLASRFFLDLYFKVEHVRSDKCRLVLKILTPNFEFYFQLNNPKLIQPATYLNMVKEAAYPA